MIAGLALTVLLATQGRPAPAKPIPADFHTQAQRYVEMGLADPRGREYREVTIRPGDIPGPQDHLIKTRGWVKPGTKQVVCWNGLLYEAVEVGAHADYREEVAVFSKTHPNAYRTIYLRESSSLQAGGVVAAALLSLLDDELNARAIYEANYQPDFGSAYGWTRYERALTRYMEGFDREALEDAVVAKRFIPMIDKRQLEGNNVMQQPPFVVVRLIQEIERRLEAPVEPFSEAHLNSLPKEERAPYLIQQLENVAERQWGQPGGVHLGMSPIVQALEQEAPEVVETLFDVAEKDHRLTRSISYHRDFFPSRHLIPVRAAALEALMQIMEVRAPISSSGKEGLGQLRALWVQTRGMIGPERWLHILQDNQAGADAWLEASQHLTEQANVRWLGAWATTQREAKTPKDTAMKGEVLRSANGEEITALIERRARQVASEAGWESSMGEFELSKACEMAVTRARWERDGATKLLQDLFKIAKDNVLKEDNQSINCGYHLISILDWRLRLDDSSALADYELLMKHPAMIEMAERAVVPLWRHRDFPGMKKLADRLLTDKSSQWHLQSKLRPDGPFYLAGLAGSKLLVLKSFRREVLELLSDKSVMRTYVRDGDQLRSGSSGMYFAPDDKLAPKLGESRDERVCDLIFSRMVFNGREKFSVYWPNREKDKVIAKVRDLIKKEEERFVNRLFPHESDPWIKDPR